MKRFVCAIFSLFIASTLACSPTADREQGLQEAVASEASASTEPPAPPAVHLKPVVEGTAPPNPYSEEQISRGELLVTIGGCNDCHTPWTINRDLGIPVPDMTRMLSGHPEGAPDAAGSLGPGDMLLANSTFTSYTQPFGTVYALNLTPDMQTGTGTWTEQMFLDIFRKGKHLGGDGRSVLPPMPWPSVAALPDDDIVAIFAYLRSIPPLVNYVPSANVPQPAIDHITVATEMLANATKEQ